MPAQSIQSKLIETLLELIKSNLASGEDVLDQRLRQILCQGEAGEARAESGDRRGYDARGQEGGDVQVFRAVER